MNFFANFPRQILIFAIFSGLFANKYDTMLFSNKYEEVRRAIDLGADVDAVVRGSTPLYDAARKNNTEILFLLLNRDADTNKKSHGETPLHKVVQTGNVKFAEALLDAGADPNITDDIRGNTALHYASARYNPKMIEVLMSYDADIYVKNKQGDTPARNLFRRVSISALKVENDELSVVSTPFFITQGSVGLSGKNRTNYFIIVTQAALYVNGELVSQADVNRSIAPNSSAGIVSLPIDRNAYKNLEVDRSGTSDVKYGFAVRYTINGSTRTLYETTKSTLRLW